MFKPTILIDFDLTISPEVGFNAPPTVEVIDAIRLLQTKYHIVIFSGRANPETSQVFERTLLEEYLMRYDIAFDEIYSSKPVFMALIDDSSYNPKKESWGAIVEDLMNRVT